MTAPIKINWSFNASVDGGPQLAAFQPSLCVSAYDYLKVPLVALATGTTAVAAVVQLQPSTAAGAVKMVAILADQYSDKITYRIGTETTDRVLDAPHVFLGTGAVGFLGTSPPQRLSFTNTLASAVMVQILVGRTE